MWNAPVRPQRRWARQARRRDVRRRAEAEVVMENVDHVANFGWRRAQYKARIKAAGRHVLTRPAACCAEIDVAQLAVLPRNFQTHFEFCLGHHRIWADEHQTGLRQVSDEAERFVGKAIEDVQVIGQLVPLDTALIEHVHRFRACRQ